MPADVIVVTGGARGMGLECARRLASPDACLLIADLDEAGLPAAEEAVAAGGAAVSTLRCDVTDPDHVTALAERVAALGALRAVVHAAGISPTMADWRRVIEVDLVGTALVMDALRPVARPGTAAVCFASSAGHGVGPDAELDSLLALPLAPGLLDRLEEVAASRLSDTGQAYSWAKRGVIALVQREAMAWGERGARICSISPGIIDTEMSRLELERQPLMATMLECTPLKRMGRPAEVAALVAFLVSDEASYLTGCDVLVDGGVTPVFGRVVQQAGGA